MKTTFAILTSAALLCGCASQQTSRPPVPDKFIKSVRIESKPPGLRAFVAYGANSAKAEGREDYIGVTPCVAQVPSTDDGCFEMPNTIRFYNMAVQPSAVFTVRPDGKNLFVKSQTFKGNAVLRNPEKIPDAIFLDATVP